MSETTELETYLQLLSTRYKATIYAGAYIDNVYAIFYITNPYFWFCGEDGASQETINSKTEIPVQLYAGSMSSFNETHRRLSWPLLFVSGKCFKNIAPELIGR